MKHKNFNDIFTCFLNAFCRLNIFVFFFYFYLKNEFSVERISCKLWVLVTWIACLSVAGRFLFKAIQYPKMDRRFWRQGAQRVENLFSLFLQCRKAIKNHLGDFYFSAKFFLSPRFAFIFSGKFPLGIVQIKRKWEMAFLLFFLFLIRHPMKWNKKKIFLFVGRVKMRLRLKAKPILRRWKIVIAIFHAFMPSISCVEMGNEEMTLKCFCWFVFRLIAFNLSILLNFPLRFIKRKIHAWN